MSIQPEDYREYAPPVEDMTAVPVTIELGPKQGVPVLELAAPFGNYTTFVFAGTENLTPVLGRDTLRARAYLLCSGTGPVYVGSNKAALEFLRNNEGGSLPSTGQVAGVAVLPSGMALPVSHQEHVYAIPDGTHSVTLTVAIERWSE